MTDTQWTIDQLAERVDAALSVGYPGQTSGRVRQVPDRRAIRYYTTLGLLDRPAAMHGRVAVYGQRHLLQLVAIKRLQAEGLSLAEVQARLAGATDARLREVARLPAAGAAPAAPAPLARARVAAARPAGDDPVAARARFWRQRPAAPATAPATTPAPPAVVQGVRLSEGTTLLVEGGRPLDDEDLRAILAAAAPLLAALRDRGLLEGRDHP
jgi:DNA-binding transcriptional MerR regulator